MKGILTLLLLLTVFIANAQTAIKKISVIAYYAGNATDIDAYPVEKLIQQYFQFLSFKKAMKSNVANNGE